VLRAEVVQVFVNQSCSDVGEHYIAMSKGDETLDMVCNEVGCRFAILLYEIASVDVMHLHEGGIAALWLHISQDIA
jgi:hypothetical protein